MEYNKKGKKKCKRTCIIHHNQRAAEWNECQRAAGKKDKQLQKKKENSESIERLPKHPQLSALMQHLITVLSTHTQLYFLPLFGYPAVCVLSANFRAKVKNQVIW